MNKKAQAQRAFNALVKEHGIRKIAYELGVSTQAIYKWHGLVPVARLNEFQDIFDLEPYQIRPDLFDAPKRK